MVNPDSANGRRPQRLKQRLKELTAQAILSAAEEVLLERGLQAPMELIAGRAGVAVGTLYNHFADREALVAALLASHREKMFADVREAERAAKALPVRDQLVAMLGAMTVAGSRVMLINRATEQFPDAKRRRRVREGIGELFGGVLRRGRSEGLLAADPEGLQPVLLQGLIQSVFSYGADEPARLPRPRAIEAVADAFLGAAAKRGGRR